MATTNSIKVADYRRLYDRLSAAFASLQSVPAGYSLELAREADMVRRTARALMGANCPTAKLEDRDMAERLIDRTASFLINCGL
jgi:hypothetical protein